MWAVEAKNFGDKPGYFYMSGLTEAESRNRHKAMVNSGDWAMVRSWDLQAQWDAENAAKRIRNWKKDAA